MNKIKLFFLFDKKTRNIFIEAFLLLAWARILKSIPFKKIHTTLGVQMEETSFDITPANIRILSQVSRAINIMSSYTIWESKCLVQAIAAMKMLERRSIESTLYLGTSLNEKGKLIAHAWLRSGPYYLTGDKGKEDFVVVYKFAKKI